MALSCSQSECVVILSVKIGSLFYQIFDYFQMAIFCSKSECCVILGVKISSLF